MIFSFADYELDTDRIEFRHDGVGVHIEPQVFDVLRYLIEHRDRVVSKIELLDNVWGGAFVGDSALTSRIKSARRLVGDDGRSQQVIRTVQRRGYQFVAEVSESAGVAGGGDAASESDITPPPSGVVSFLFGVINGASQSWERHPDLMSAAAARYDEILRQAVDNNSGAAFTSAVDGVGAAFVLASEAVAAAREVRAAVDDEPWPEPLQLRVGLGVHTGEAVVLQGRYYGSEVNRAARVVAAAHGGQTLVSDATIGLLNDDDGLTDLGLCQIDRDMPLLRLWQLDGQAFPPLAGASTPTPPALRTELIGRESQLEAVVESVARHRLVSIVGPGGAGKTTLAVAAANAVDRMTHAAGIAFVELASLDDGNDIFRALVDKTGVEGAAAADLGSLAAHLARRPILLILDNCEHVLDECADIIDLLLDAGGEATVLATSREPLGIDGEVVVPLGSLDAFGPELFMARALAARPTLGLAADSGGVSDAGVDADDPRVVDICQALDGLPLAIELAAAQLQHLTLNDLVSRLDAALELTRGGRSRGRSRHVTLEETISWSYDLLDESGRWLLRQLGVFPGSFDLEAAEAAGRASDEAVGETVNGWTGGVPTLPALADLVAKNLVVHESSTGRYRLLETIRAFAWRRLVGAGEADDAAERLRVHVVDRATARTRTDRWLSGCHAAAVRLDVDNERFAFERSIRIGRTVDALEIHIGSSYLFRNTSSCVDGRWWVDALKPVEDQLAQRDRLWFTIVQADLAQGTADHRGGMDAAARALALTKSVDDPAAEVIARHFEAVHLIVPAPAEAMARLVDALDVARALGDPRLEQLLEAFMALAELSAGNGDKGMAIAETVGHQVDGDGYEFFIAHFAAWTSSLIQADVEQLRYWLERQRRHLLQIGLSLPWQFEWSTGLVDAVEGGDPIAGLQRTRDLANVEGHDLDADIVLALATIERHGQRCREAAEMLGAIKGRELGNLSHYILARYLRNDLRAELGDEVLREAMAEGARYEPGAILELWGFDKPVS